MKEEFIENLIWSNTIGAAFQRVKIYNEKANDINRRNFKAALHRHIQKLAEQYKDIEVSEEVHLKNIQSVSSEMPAEHSAILIGGKLNYGVSQKLLNLYLKYKWCLGKSNTPPPHFPVDRMIQDLLKVDIIDPWTKMETKEQYMAIVEHARNKLTEHKQKNLANLELYLYNRG